ncbi:hypothetical protein E5288_WYG013268 [Bos mutus]|uniref:Peptidase M10 metallopeptidase domain-containing protein n=1 Tax=Bos mutus TaxID=72004 RepID=A0A6B0S5B6_9CETA|nr:hypothetical protein [Bos mutus]
MLSKTMLSKQYSSKGLEISVHFDDDELWTNDSKGHQCCVFINFFPVFAHEFGHTLGPHRSSNAKALIYTHVSQRKNFSKDVGKDLVQDRITGEGPTQYECKISEDHAVQMLKGNDLLNC